MNELERICAVAILMHGERERARTTRLGTPLIPWQNVEAWARRVIDQGAETRRETLLRDDAIKMANEIGKFYREEMKFYGPIS